MMDVYYHALLYFLIMDARNNKTRKLDHSCLRRRLG